MRSIVYLLFFTMFLLSAQVFPVSAILTRVAIHATARTATVGKGSIGLSALAYNENNQPIWTGVTYEWGVSSTNSVGSVTPLLGTITNFIPLNAGVGDVYVIARQGTQMQSAGVQMTVVLERQGDLNNDGRVTLSDLSTMLSNFGKSNRVKSQGDLNGDGNVTLADLSTLLSNFGK